MKSKTLLFAIAFIALFTGNVGAANIPKTNDATCDLRTESRKLWEDHITWTRNVIFNIIDALPGAETAVPRLLQNQVDIGNLFARYYGQTVGDSIAALLTIHITTAADLLNALVAGDDAAIAAANEAWYENGEDIVAYLTSINPKYDEEALDEMMDMHLDLTADEAVARLHKDYTADVAAYDAVHAEALNMSDFLVNGIIAQFPKMFRGNPNARMAQTVDLINEAALGQNYPNPFDDHTVISYLIPDDAQTAQIVFQDMTGRVIKTLSIDGRGEGDLTVNAHGLTRGVYTYTIIIDGKVSDVKRMVH